MLKVKITETLCSVNQSKDVSLDAQRDADQSSPVWRVPTKFLLIDIATKQFHIATTAVELLLVLHRELQHQCLVLVAELGVLC